MLSLTHEMQDLAIHYASSEIFFGCLPCIRREYPRGLAFMTGRGGK